MSAYTTRLCLEHGEWDDDVDNPSDCPDCIKEGKTEVQRLKAENAALREAAKDACYSMMEARSSLHTRGLRPESCAAMRRLDEGIVAVRRALEGQP